jgi:enolase
MKLTISSIKALQILDSRGKPTVRAFITLSDGSTHQSSVPSGASTGSHEAVELRDKDERNYFGESVQNAVNNINTVLNQEFSGKEIKNEDMDKKMLEIDGTENKAKLGANAILAVSQALLKAGAYENNLPLWKYINQIYFSDKQPNYPRLFANVINGGKHADWNFDIQEFIISPQVNTPSAAVKVAAEIFQKIGKDLKSRKLSKLVGDEGGYSPALSSNEEAFELIINAAEEIGYDNGKDFHLAIDAAASEFYEDGSYVFKKDNKKITGDELLSYYMTLYDRFKVFSMEDPFFEDDWEHFTKITASADNKFIVVGDDLLVTNTSRIEQAMQEKACSAALIKPNQIGSIYETVQAIKKSKAAGWKVIISHRSGETEDSFIADLAYASAADFIKTGSTCRSERLSKYNRLMEIENGL